MYTVPDHCCAKCHHWGVETRDYTRRMKAIENGMICSCPHWEGKVTAQGIGRTVAYGYCLNYEEEALTNRPMMG